MDQLPCQGCKGLCCGPVPVTAPELKRIKKRIQSMPRSSLAELKNQERFWGTCIFYDVKRDACGIHSARPSTCQAFGYHKNLVCFRKPEAANKPKWTLEGEIVGLLSVDITWKDF